jgi:polyisoprenoid-binding protein YceI
LRAAELQILTLLLPGLLVGGPLAGQAQETIASARVISGSLSFDGHATVGDFTGSTTTVSGRLQGAPEVTGVRGWVEAPVRTLKTGDSKRDRDLNKSMESEKFPVLRFDLARVTRAGGMGDSLDVMLHGTLRIHGVSRDVELPATLWFRGSDVRVRSDFPLNLKDYRIGGLSKLFGVLKMYNDIEVHVDVVFRRFTSSGAPGFSPAVR